MIKNANILVIDDNKNLLSALELMLTPFCNRLKCLQSPNSIHAELQSHSYDVVLLDMNFKAGINTGNEGIYWLNQILERHANISVIMITAFGDVELAVKAVRLGAFDFILKPWNNEKLLATIEAAWKLSRSKNEVNQLQLKQVSLIEEINKTYKPIIGKSEAWRQIMDMVQKIAATDVNVLITGENGTGKELVAKEIHRLSARAGRVMVSVDMGSVAESLFESELFGHKKGAFTDAHSDRMGKIEAANQGTLFLDEIGNLSLAMQAKLLTVLQNKTLNRVGDNKNINVDIRLICATNSNLSQMVEKEQFREDLLYRINTIQIELPPLRKRVDDIPELTNFFLEKYAKKYNKKKIRIDNEALEKLKNYTWPGNVRELQHAIEKAVILADKNTLSADDFLFKSTSGNSNTNYSGTLEDMERKLIANALEKHGSNLSAVANQLGISRQTLYNKIKKHGL